MMISDITVALFESTFPSGFEPPELECSLSVTDSSSFDFAIFPTVTTGRVTIGLSEEIRSQVVIYNVSGQRLFSSNYDSRTIQLDLNISTGAYFVSIASEIGSETKKIVIK